MFLIYKERINYNFKLLYFRAISTIRKAGFLHVTDLGDMRELLTEEEYSMVASNNSDICNWLLYCLICNLYN